MRKKSLAIIMALCLLATGCYAGSTTSVDETKALVVNRISDNNIGYNAYLAQNESLLHHDTYNSDVTNKILPLGIYPEITSSRENVLINCVSCFFYDDYGNCYTPYSIPVEGGRSPAGVAIRDVDQTPAKTLGAFLPHIDDPEEKYGVQNSYAYIDREGYMVCPTNHGHVIVLKTIDENGNPLEHFQKVADVNVLSCAKKALGDDINKNLLGIIPDYQGNVWFVTGGFRMDPYYEADGFMGYIEKECIDLMLAGKKVDIEDYVYCYRLGKGENAENGISSHEEGCVILTNQNCYLAATSDEGVKVNWKTPYESDGGEKPDENRNNGIPGAGMAWGSGATPTLTNDFVFFTNNKAPIELIALDVHTGEVVGNLPIFEGSKDIAACVENSILVYSDKENEASIMVYNWYGAGSASLYSHEADSTIQLFSNLYDRTWIAEGSDSLMPGVEKISIKKTTAGYEMKSEWTRMDLCSTCMFKLSTANGHVYGYTEIDGMWQYLVLDWNTGETLLSIPVSTQARYNNLGSGMMQGNDGNSLYCPTNNRELLCLHDRFAYLPEKEYVRLSIFDMERYFCDSEWLHEAEENATAATYLHSAVIESVLQPTIIAFRINGLEGELSSFKLFLQLSEGGYEKYDNEWQITKEGGEALSENEKLNPSEIYEIRFAVEDAADYDLNPKKEDVKIAMLLAK